MFFTHNHFLVFSLSTFFLPIFILPSSLSLLHTYCTCFPVRLLQGYWYFKITLRHLSHMQGCWTDTRGRPLCHECHVHICFAAAPCRKPLSAKPLSWASFAVLEEAGGKSRPASCGEQWGGFGAGSCVPPWRTGLRPGQFNMFNYLFTLATLSDERGFILNSKFSAFKVRCQVKNDSWDFYQILLIVHAGI